jgi:hypothetical protein
MHHIAYTLLFFPLLFVGCWTGVTIPKSNVAPDDTKVTFYLMDGSYVKSYAGHHQRIENGYEVSGFQFCSGQASRTFKGVISDEDIMRLRKEGFSWIGTLLGLGLGAPSATAIVFILAK